MSINNVRLQDNYNRPLGSTQVPFILEELEILKFSTPTPRQSLSITLKDPVTRNISIVGKDGHIFLTNKRFIFITASLGDIDTFLIDMKSASILQFSHLLKSPWFGANYWEFMFFTKTDPNVTVDGFPKNEWFKGKVNFNDGGIFDFIGVLNEVLNDAVNNNDIDEELPRYTPT